MRLKSLLLLAVMLVVCGCLGRGELIPRLSGIEFVAKMTYYNESYSASVLITEDGSININMLLPDEIKGLKICYEAGEFEAEYLGVKYKPDTQKMPMGFVCKTFCEILSDSIGKSAFESDGNFKICGEFQNKRYDFYFSPAALPLYIVFPDDNLRIEFSKVTLK